MTTATTTAAGDQAPAQGTTAAEPRPEASGVRPIRVLIADDHNLVREGIRLLLSAQSDIRVVGEASTGREAINEAERLKPDVVILDITMPEMGGLEALQELAKLVPEARVLMLTMHDGAEFFFRVLNAGAAGYVVKGAPSGELISAVRTVHQGGAFLHPALARKLVDDYVQRTQTSAESLDGLSKRELEVLQLVARGKSNREIAEGLVITLSTVQTHRAHIMEKLNLQNRTDLVKYALRKGLIDLDA